MGSSTARPARATTTFRRHPRHQRHHRRPRAAVPKRSSTCPGPNARQRRRLRLRLRHHPPRATCCRHSRRSCPAFHPALPPAPVRAPVPAVLRRLPRPPPRRQSHPRIGLMARKPAPKKVAPKKAAPKKPPHHENLIERVAEKLEARFFEGAEWATETSSAE